MSYHVDDRGDGPHINLEPSSVAGLREADESYREAYGRRAADDLGISVNA